MNAERPKPFEVVELRPFLPHAAENGHVELTELVLAAGADPNSRNPYGDVPLMYALTTEEFETARALLENGADPNLTKQFGMSTFAGATWRLRLCWPVAPAEGPSSMASSESWSPSW